MGFLGSSRSDVAYPSGPRIDTVRALSVHIPAVLAAPAILTSHPHPVPHTAEGAAKMGLVRVVVRWISKGLLAH
jgi:hypothetical protein